MALIGAILTLLVIAPALAETIVFGAVTPLGPNAKAAIETALDVVNLKHEEMPVLFGQGGGLDRLGGATLRAVYGDDNNDPARAASEAERLVGAEHAVALIGGGTDATAAAIGAVAERHQLPFLSPLRSPAERKDLSWLFRLGPTADITAAAIFGFPGDRVKTVALVWDDSPFGRENAEAQRKVAEAADVTIVADLKLAPDAASLAAEALVIAGAKPDAVIPSLGLQHAVMLLRALAEQHAAPIVLASGGGFRDPAFLTGAGATAEGVFCVAGFAAGRQAVPVIDAAFRARAGAALDEDAARVIMGTLLLADVIDRAGTTKPIELRAALMATNTPAEALVLAWAGIRFDDAARNVLATPAIEQVQRGVYRTVAPEGLASAPPDWPGK